MIRISNIKFNPENVPQNFKTFIEKLTGFTNILSLRIAKKSIDARKKGALSLLYTFDVTIAGDEEEAIRHCLYKDVTVLAAVEQCPFSVWRSSKKNRPVVIGTGPAGLMAGLYLAQSGANPILIERGKSVSKRREDVNLFWKSGELNENSNVQFGEGGAGTFSDGKLTTGIKKDCWTRKVLEEFVSAGAPEEIMYLSKPHIGTDKLFHMVSNLRHKILSLGGEYRFETRLTDLIIKNDRLVGIKVKDKTGNVEEIMTENLILAIGHSARDTFEMLYRKGVKIDPKPFAVGVRIEHLQSFINKSQYGMSTPPEILGAASYKLVAHTGNGRSLYTFCMCPGGTVVAAASEAGRLVTNGMSEYARNKTNANSALLVNVNVSDFGSNHALGGIEFQRKIEQKAFQAGGGSFRAPVQMVSDFLQNRETTRFAQVVPSYLPGVQPADIRAVLPSFITETMKEGLKQFERKIKNFCLHDAVLTAAETRTSSPVRIVRNPDTLQSVNISGLYPCGEGAGYAGGIMSAGVDGLKCAYKILQSTDD